MTYTLYDDEMLKIFAIQSMCMLLLKLNVVVKSVHVEGLWEDFKISVTLKDNY
jgi:hypothetical protein